MPVLTWSDDLVLGVAVMDDDHKELVALINRAADADAVALPAVFEALIAHLHDHFAREEDLMERIGFFALDTHREEHTRALIELRRIKERVDALPEAANEASLAFLRSYVTWQLPQWFVHHHNTMDTLTAAYAAHHDA